METKSILYLHVIPRTPLPQFYLNYCKVFKWFCGNSGKEKFQGDSTSKASQTPPSLTPLQVNFQDTSGQDSKNLCLVNSVLIILYLMTVALCIFPSNINQIQRREIAQKTPEIVPSRSVTKVIKN